MRREQVPPSRPGVGSRPRGPGAPHSLVGSASEAMAAGRPVEMDGDRWLGLLEEDGSQGVGNWGRGLPTSTENQRVIFLIWRGTIDACLLYNFNCLDSR